MASGVVQSPWHFEPKASSIFSMEVSQFQRTKTSFLIGDDAMTLSGVGSSTPFLPIFAQVLCMTALQHKSGLT